MGDAECMSSRALLTAVETDVSISGGASRRSAAGGAWR